MPKFEVDGRWVGSDQPTYFIADIAANHDGDLSRAIDLIYIAAEAGADAAKFQHFRAKHIVSDVGFKALGSQKSHQSQWKKSVYEVYEAASLPWSWTEDLIAACQKAGITFFSAPYDLEAVEMLASYDIPAFKMGSGDITWHTIIQKMAETGKPLFLSTGAATIDDVSAMHRVVSAYDNPVCIMQCNTNYTGSLDNFKHIHLNVLKTYAALFPEYVLGLSDHTPGDVTTLGAVALGARVIEKHFTDDCSREGPDHPFSMDPRAWREMVARTRELEAALGSTEKRIAENEMDPVILQRRCIRAKRDLPAGHVLSEADVEMLRPAPADSSPPYRLNALVGRRLKTALVQGAHLTEAQLVAEEILA